MQLRTALAGTDLAGQLSAKVSAVIDLDGFAADILLRTVDHTRVSCRARRRRTTASALGGGPLGRELPIVLYGYSLLARRAGAAGSRMREAVARGGLVGALERAHRQSRDLLIDAPTPARSAAIRTHRNSSTFRRRQHVGRWAAVWAFRYREAFGPGRGSPPIWRVGRARLTGTRAAADRPVVRRDGRRWSREAATLSASSSIPRDPRRQVVACAGAPICASGQIAARAMAPAVADAARALPRRRDRPYLRLRQGLRPSGALRRLRWFGRDGRCDVFADGVL